MKFEGRDLMALDERELRRVRGARIGFVFQEPMTALNPAFTVGGQVAEVLEVHGLAAGAAARARAVELLDAVRIPDPSRRARDFPHQLSGGMRQRVLIAAAIACRPPLVVADEPTTALDATIQADILDLLLAMRREAGLSLLLITHDLGVVARVADRVAIMYAGRIVEAGPAREVLAAPGHPYTRGLLASRPGGVPGTRLEAIPGTVPDLAMLPPGCAFAPRCPARFETCDTSRPDAYTVSPGRTARCFLPGGVAR
jgi:oligopeptide/dipeptide ABC transporter ATP-binding protein